MNKLTFLAFFIVLFVSIQTYAQTRIHELSGSSRIYRITHEARGRCIRSVAASHDIRAWRCFGTSDSGVYDPCFKKDETHLLCYNSPWDLTVTLLTTEAPLTEKTQKVAATKAFPWAIELADKTRCVFLPGATRGIQGLRINYGCLDGSKLVGDINRMQPTWEIKQAKKTTGTKKEILQIVQIADVW